MNNKPVKNYEFSVDDVYFSFRRSLNPSDPDFDVEELAGDSCSVLQHFGEKYKVEREPGADGSTQNSPWFRFLLL